MFAAACGGKSGGAGSETGFNADAEMDKLFQRYTTYIVEQQWDKLVGLYDDTDKTDPDDVSVTEFHDIHIAQGFTLVAADQRRRSPNTSATGRYRPSETSATMTGSPGARRTGFVEKVWHRKRDPSCHDQPRRG